MTQLIAGVDPLQENNTIKDKTISKIQGSNLYQIPVPFEFEGKSYGKLFNYLTQEKSVIPIGILRGTFTHLKMGPKFNRMPYVFTNPSKDVELYSCDSVYILSQYPLESVLFLCKEEYNNYHFQ